jgi:hypothetical protein
MEMETDTVLVALLLAPLVAYAALSLDISEIGFAGFKAKFGKAASEKIDHNFGKIGPSFQDLAEVGQRGVLALEEMLENYHLSEAKPIVMILKAGVGGYPRQETLGFIEKLSRYRSFQFVVIVDRDDRVKGYMPSWAARRVLGNQNTGDDFLKIVNDMERHHELSHFPYIQTATLQVNDTNAKALREMTRQNLDAFIVVDEEEQLMGVVERDKVLSKMMMSIVDEE